MEKKKKTNKSDEALTGMLQSWRRNNISILLLAKQVHTELSKSWYINMVFKMKPLCFNNKKRDYYIL